MQIVVSIGDIIAGCLFVICGLLILFYILLWSWCDKHPDNPKAEWFRKHLLK